MDISNFALIVGVLCFVLGFGVAFWVKGRVISQKVKAAEREAAQIISDSKRKGETLLKEAELEIKDRLLKMKSDFDTETKETRGELKKRDRRLIQKEENFERKSEKWPAATKN